MHKHLKIHAAQWPGIQLACFQSNGSVMYRRGTLKNLNKVCGGLECELKQISSLNKTIYCKKVT